jgi:nucleoside 2-deoxyribosyltransferase
MGKHEMIYLIGSLRNPEVPKAANSLREAGFEVFDDWYAAGPEADDKWRDYEQGRGHSYLEGLRGAAARNVYNFDRLHLDMADTVLLVLPAGKSGHLELGWAIGRGKKGYILLDSPDRWDVMYQFADGVFDKLEDLVCELKSSRSQPTSSVLPSTYITPSILPKAEYERLIRQCTGQVLPSSLLPSTEEELSSHGWGI